MNEGYELLRDAICPQDWTEYSQAAAQAILDAYAQEHGDMALQAAISAGQYGHPKGLFFGGNSTTWSADTLASVISKHAAGARHVGFIDYHTGLGDCGDCEMISDHKLSEPGHNRLLEWLGANQVTSTGDGTSASAPLSGVNSLCVAGAAPHASLTMVTLEFGTSPVKEVLDSLRADCWLHNFGDLECDQALAIKAEIRRCFYPDTDDWKIKILDHASEAELKMVAGLSGQI